MAPVEELWRKLDCMEGGADVRDRPKYEPQRREARANAARGKDVLERGLGHPHLAKLRRDLCFEPCGHGNDVATAGRLVLCLVINELSGTHRIVRTVTSLYSSS
jgi:hypothetical protein